MPVAYFFRPDFDLPTRYMNYWLGVAKGDVAGLGFQVLDSSGEYATKYSFFETLETYSPDVVIAGAHGDPSTLTGQGMKEVLEACFNNEVLSGKVMCAVSCLTGQTLGPDSRDKEAEAYMGFVNEFSWAVDPTGNPVGDRIAYSFQQIVRRLVVSSCEFRLRRLDLKGVYDQVISEFESWIEYYSVPPGSEVVDSYGTRRANDILLSLRHDKSGLITVGKDLRYVEAVPISVTPFAMMGVGALACFLPFM